MIEKSEGIVPALQIILKTERMYVFFEELFNDIFAPGVYGINWTAAWQRKLSFQRKKDHGL